MVSIAATTAKFILTGRVAGLLVRILMNLVQAIRNVAAVLFFIAVLVMEYVKIMNSNVLLDGLEIVAIAEQNTAIAKSNGVAAASETIPALGRIATAALADAAEKSNATAHVQAEIQLQATTGKLAETAEQSNATASAAIHVIQDRGKLAELAAEDIMIVPEIATEIILIAAV